MNYVVLLILRTSKNLQNVGGKDARADGLINLVSKHTRTFYIDETGIYYGADQGWAGTKVTRTFVTMLNLQNLAPTLTVRLGVVDESQHFKN